MADTHHYHTDITMKDDDPQSWSTILVGLVGFVLLFVIVILLHTIFLITIEAEHQKKIIAAKPAELGDMRVQQSEALDGYRWVNEQDGVAAIPLERAIDLVVEDYETQDGE